MKKKIIGLAIILSMLTALLSVGVNAAPTLLWDFGEGTDIEDNMGGKSAANVLTYEAESFYHIFTAQGNDPYVSVDYSMDDVSQVFWVKARVLNKSYATAIELFGATNGRGLAGPECTHIDILPNHDEWQTVIVNIPESNINTVNNYKAVDPITETYWEGTLDWIRLDPMWSEGDDGSDSGGSMVDGEQIYIDYIAFFSSEADAIAYVGTQEQAELDAAAAAAAAEAPEVAEPADEAPAETPVDVTPAAPQTSDVASLAFASLVIALGTGYIVSKKK
ncbi:MAG: hypothetical protein PHZ09_08075 [Eubacteriales bacterium]|nr:hypothetical protein [Eubacteriales bacterium]